MNTALRRARNRQMVIFLLVCSGMVVLLGRLYYWQVLQSHSGYNLAQLASEEHTQILTLDAPRGIIYDSQGHILATNVVRDDVYIEPIQFFVDHPDDSDAALAGLVHTLHEVLPTLAEDRLSRDFKSGLQTLRIAGPIDPAQSARLRELHLPDIFLEPRTWRIYPGGDLAAQVLGFVQNGTPASTALRARRTSSWRESRVP